MKSHQRLILTLVLTLSAISSAAAKDDETLQFVALMNDYMTLANKVVDAAERPQAAIFMAIEGIYEVYEQRRDAPGAVRHLSNILDNHPNDRVVRNLVRFKLRDIYKETGDADKALEQMDLIIAENANQ